jgi:hypothetical protein
MDTFQITVLVVATILLILIFATVGILTKYASFDKIYPPIANTCPDYWSSDTNGHCKIPGIGGKNIKKLYSNRQVAISSNIDNSSYTPGYSNGAINFSDSGWSSLGTSALCGKKNWANKYGIAWDGVSNYNSCV